MPFVRSYLRSFNCKERLSKYSKTSASISPLTSVPSSTLRLLPFFPIPAQFVSISYHNRLILLVLLDLSLMVDSGSEVKCESSSRSTSVKEVTNGPICTVVATEWDCCERLWVWLVRVDATLPKRRGFCMFSIIREARVTDMLDALDQNGGRNLNIVVKIDDVHI